MESPAPPALSFPVGFRFRPTENELLGYYLRGRIAYGPSYFGPHCLVKDRDLYGKTEPWVIWEEELRLLGINKEEEEEELPDLYFFTELKKKSKNGSNFGRLIGSGFWKGEDSGFKVKEYLTNRVLGVRKRYRYEGGDPKQEGHWILTEFTLDPSLLPNSQQPNNLVVCKLRYNKKAASVAVNKKKVASRPSKKRKANRDQELIEEAVPSKKRLGISVFTTLNPCSAKPQPHAESQGECSTVVVADHPLGLPHPCTASKMEHHDETSYFHAESQLQQQYSTLVEDHHSGFPLPCPATKEEYHDETTSAATANTDLPNDETSAAAAANADLPNDETSAAAAANADLPNDETSAAASAANTDLPNDDWWRELLGDETFTCNGDNNYLELDDLSFDHLSPIPHSLIYLQPHHMNS